MNRDGASVRSGDALAVLQSTILAPSPFWRIGLKELTLLEILDEAFRNARDLDAPLSRRLESFADNVRTVSSEFADAVDRLIYRLQQSGTGNGAPKIGEPLPPFDLPDSAGKLVTLQELLEAGPVALTFHRGHWCPYCRINTNALSDLQCRILPQGAQIVAITPETSRYSTLLKEEHKSAPIRVLSDMDSGYAMSLNLVMFVGDEMKKAMMAAGVNVSTYQGNEAWILPVPATFVVDQQGLIRARFIDPDYRKRMAIEDIDDALHEARNPLPPQA